MEVITHYLMKDVPMRHEITSGKPILEISKAEVFLTHQTMAAGVRETERYTTVFFDLSEPSECDPLYEILTTINNGISFSSKGRIFASCRVALLTEAGIVSRNHVSKAVLECSGTLRKGSVFEPTLEVLFIEKL